ncbi:hypothetical protein PWT90_04653 [Aphanocladium album]|nr:hypothetical protein PWT90_04653 [Aphanocladium album]
MSSRRNIRKGHLVSMRNTFAPFLRLPIEVRFLIWEYAFEVADWSILKPGLCRAGITLRGKKAAYLDVASEQALRVIQLKHTYVPGFGWLNHCRSLVFIRDFMATPGLKHIAAHGQNFLSRLFHVVLNPRNMTCLLESVKILHSSCPALQTLVLVGPWFMPEDTTEYNPDKDWRCLTGYEDWPELFKRSPEEVATTDLLEAIENGKEANQTWLAHYHRLLDQAVERLPHPLPSGLRPFDNEYWRVRHNLRKVTNILLKFHDWKPNLYLRTTEQLHRPAQSRRSRHSERLSRTLV